MKSNACVIASLKFYGQLIHLFGPHHVIWKEYRASTNSTRQYSVSGVTRVHQYSGSGVTWVHLEILYNINAPVVANICGDVFNRAMKYLRLVQSPKMPEQVKDNERLIDKLKNNEMKISCYLKGILWIRGALREQ